MYHNFIPRAYSSEPITIRLKPDELEFVSQLAADYNLSRSEFIHQCIAFAVRHLPGTDNTGPFASNWHIKSFRKGPAMIAGPERIYNRF